MDSHDLTSLKATAQQSAPWPPRARRALALPVSASQTTSLLVGLFLSLLVLFAALIAQTRTSAAPPAHPALTLFTPAGVLSPDSIGLVPAAYFAPASGVPGEALYTLARQVEDATALLRPGESLHVRLAVGDWPNRALMAQRWQVLAALFQPAARVGAGTVHVDIVSQDTLASVTVRSAQ